MINEYRDVIGYESHYMVSFSGEVVSKERFVAVGKKLGGIKRMPSIRKKTRIYGHYLTVPLSSNGLTKHWLVHRVVALAFVPNPNNYPCVNHIDGNKLNNAANNLEWCTHKQNVAHAFRIGLSSNITPFCQERQDMIEKIKTLKPFMKRGYSIRVANMVGSYLGCVKEASKGFITNKNKLQKIIDAMAYDKEIASAVDMPRNNKGQYIKQRQVGNVRP